MTRPSVRRAVEVACDESGAEGEKLIGGNTDVFAHASVCLAAPAAAAGVQEIRDRIRSPAVLCKAGHLLREKHKPVLSWFLSPAGPVCGRAHVVLIHKEYLLAGALIRLLSASPGAAGGAGECLAGDVLAGAGILCRECPHTLGRERWRALLASFNAAMRARGSGDVQAAAGRFLRLLGEASRDAARGPAGDVLNRLWQSRGNAVAYFAGHHPVSLAQMPPLDPLLPAIAGCVGHWGAGGDPVAIVHDRQATLTQARIAHLRQVCAAPDPGGSAPSRLASLRLVSARTDARVQLADFLSGVARKIASDELNRRGDAGLSGLLRPYLDSASIWGDPESWSVLAPGPEQRPAPVQDR